MVKSSHIKTNSQFHKPFTQNQIDVAANMNSYQSNKFAPSFGKHSKTASQSTKSKKHQPEYLLHQDEFPLVKEVNISNIDSDDDPLDSDRAHNSNDPSKHNFKIL